ncbi:NAD(P)/FAD-dependent oxidoreductase [Mollicutes bacterium LVI A0039]|nr:NAD(P)/FAD-dependent oxidoreductase [Mollicutes bacterium LVI A0039]
MKYDVVIIGAGILGSTIADNLAKYKLNTLVLEKGCDSGLEQSMSSSAIVHSGIDPKSGSQKAKYNVLGNRMMKGLCNDLNVDYLECGGYVCASDEQELEHLKKLLKNGQERDIECEIISGDTLRSREPHVSLNIKYALAMPTTAVIYPTELTVACLERAMNNDVKVEYNTEVKAITHDGASYSIETDRETINCECVINCAGMNSDLIAKMVDKEFAITLKPKRGEYFVTNNIKPVVSSVIYPVPNENGKGVLAVPTTHGNVLLGPNGVYQEDRNDDSTSASGLGFVQANTQRIIAKFPTDIIKTYAGLRSSGNNGDFYLAPCNQTQKMFNLVAIDSPGIASAPALAKEASDWVVNLLNPELSSDYQNERPRYVKMAEYDLATQNQMIKQNQLYGKIICRCEQVSKGEIRDAIRKQNGAKNLTGIKFRIRPMLGMCQGGFCETEVVRILADELGVDITDISRSGKQTIVLKGSKDESV